MFGRLGHRARNMSAVRKLFIQAAQGPDPLAHPEIRAMDRRELADLPMASLSR